MKNSINIFNALNESLEKEFKAKRKAKLKESEEHIDIEALVNKFDENYNFLYNAEGGVAGEEEAVEAFDKYIKNPEFKKYVAAYGNYVGDFISSDREAAAFMFAMEDLGYLDKIDSMSESVEKPIDESPVLEPRYDSRKSFYGKAKVEDDKLYSYNTLVAEIKDGKPVVYGLYSQTTARHIKEWLRQNGFKAESSKQIMNDYGVKEESAPIEDNKMEEIVEGIVKDIVNEAIDEDGTIVKAIQDAFDGSDFIVYGIQFVDDCTVKFQVSAFGPDGEEMIREVSLDIPKSKDYDEVKTVVEDWMQEHNSPDLFYEGLTGVKSLKEAKVTDYVSPEELDDLIKNNPVLGNTVNSYRVLDDMIIEITTDMGKSFYKIVTDTGDKLEAYWIDKDGKALGDTFILKEGEVVTVQNTQTEPDYIISDVTVLDTVGDGDVQSPDIDALLTLIDESLKSEYSNEWGRIKTLSSSKNEAYSYALVDISTPEILKEFEEKGIEDAAIGKNLILESLPLGMFKFKVNNLNGITKYSKVTDNPQQAIYEWVESEFLHEAKEEKVKELEILKAKTEKETIENYIENRIDLRQEIENIKMFIELGKQVKASEEMKPAIQKRMYAFAAEMPHNIEVSNKEDKYELSFGSLDKTVEIIFGKQWVKETEEIPEVVELKEAYEQFNIGDIEVVFNPETYECLYSIPSAEVKDKKINLTKVPSVDTPYDTNTIIKSYIETKFGVLPSEEEKKMIDQGEVSAPEQDLAPIPTDDVEVPVELDTELEEDELPEEPTEGEPTSEVPVEDELPTSETGNAIFMKIRPKQPTNIESLRQRTFDGDTPESNYIVVDNIDLNDEDWNDLTSDLTKQQSYLSGIQPIDRKNYSFNVVKLTNAESNFDLLVDPLGYNYPRYIAIIDKQVQ
jgi:hypothetical protein